MLNIVWFRRDLRITDHAPLLRAVAEGIALPLYIADPAYWGQPQTSARQWRFTARALSALRSQLAVLGAPLAVRVGPPIEVFEQLRSTSNGVTLWSHRGAETPYARTRDQAVSEWAAERDIPWNIFDAPGYSPDSPWLEQMAAETLPAPEMMIAHGVLPGKIVSERILYLDDDDCADVPAGPLPARQTLLQFLNGGAEHYQTARRSRQLADGPFPRLSAHRALGTISDREAWQMARDALEGAESGAASSLKHFMGRLSWRRRFYDLSKSVPAPLPSALEALWPEARDVADRLDAWAAGKTGFPVIDAAMRCLSATGWLPDQSRFQATRFASLILQIPPDQVGQIFAQRTTDYWPESFFPNLYAATGAWGGPVRLPDPVSIATSADPDGAFIREWVPELGSVADTHLAAPWEMSDEEQSEAGVIIGNDYPGPIVELGSALNDARTRLDTLFAAPDYPSERAALLSHLGAVIRAVTHA
ncbi:MAG: FAD-binding domain-containing protein [Pseudomonadota bacterium]